MNISFVCGLCVKYDAISNSIRAEINWLREFRNHDVRLYAYVCDDENLPFRKVNALQDVIFDPFFQASKLVVFHFGVYFDLFDSIFVTSCRAKRLVIFHNITPKQFLPLEFHKIIDRSFAQLSNMVYADHIGCDSQTNLDVLQSAGIRVAATVLSLSIGDGLRAPGNKPSKVDRIIRVAFVGRFVRSKGPLELITAIAENLRAEQSQHWRVDFVGNLDFSDAEIVIELRKRIQAIHREYGTRANISIIGNTDDDYKKAILFDSDLFVLPTYHEGFCVPILEALASGCRVIAFDNSNTPAISGGLATLVPTGDISSLVFAIQDSVRTALSETWNSEGVGSYQEYAAKAGGYAQQYSTERTRSRYLSFIDRLTGGDIVEEHGRTRTG